MAKRRARARKAAPKKKRSTRRAATSRARPTVVYVQNPSNPRRKKRRSSSRKARPATRRRSTRRRRNPEGFSFKDGLIAIASAAGAIGLAALAVEHEVLPTSLTDSPYKAAAVNVVLAAAGGYAAYKLTKSAPAALGIVAGLGGLAVYGAAVSPAVAEAEPASGGASISGNAPLGAVEVPYGYRMGAVEVPQMGAVVMNGLYSRYDQAAVNGNLFAE